uniref:Uncharacterized protein n=1 Tax=Romanomermis culicivorax TaxID=13658 RepID=A0A915KMF3_ROMCU
MPKPPPRIKKQILSAMQSPKTLSPSSTLHSKTDELCPSRVEFYPEDLNPFSVRSSDDAHQSISTSRVDSKTYLSVNKVSLNDDSTNPFLSDEEDVKSISSSVSSSWNVCDEQSELHDGMDVSFKM